MNEHTNTRGRRAGLAVGAAMVIGVASGGFWASDVPTQASATSQTCINWAAGWVGLPGPCDNTKLPKLVRTIVGRTSTGCILGGVVGPEGILPGCMGGVTSVIAW